MAYRVIFNQTGYLGRGAVQEPVPELRRRGYTKRRLRRRVHPGQPAARHP